MCWMYLSCIFAGKRLKGHPCAFPPDLALVYKIDFEGLNRRPVNDNTPGVYLIPPNCKQVFSSLLG